MCLEDRFLFALYNQSGFVPMKDLADSISVTDNALLSIIHRVTADYPDYLILERAPENGFEVSPNKELQTEVRMFLADGGFTAINEQELREYYETEMEQYTRLQRLKNTLQEYKWIKWTVGSLLTIGAGIGIAALIKTLRKQSSRLM